MKVKIIKEVVYKEKEVPKKSSKLESIIKLGLLPFFAAIITLVVNNYTSSISDTKKHERALHEYNKAYYLDKIEVVTEEYLQLYSQIKSIDKKYKSINNGTTFKELKVLISEMDDFKDKLEISLLRIENKLNILGLNDDRLVFENFNNYINTIYDSISRKKELKNTQLWRQTYTIPSEFRVEITEEMQKVIDSFPKNFNPAELSKVSNNNKVSVDSPLANITYSPGVLKSFGVLEEVLEEDNPFDYIQYDKEVFFQIISKKEHELLESFNLLLSNA